MHLEWLTPDDSEGLRLWDEFLLNTPRGHYCQLSTWLRSFEAYRFTFTVLIARRLPSCPIAGGVGVLQFGNETLGLMTVPMGPILDIGCEDLGQPLLEETLRHARSSGVFLLQLQFPCSVDACSAALLETIPLPESTQAHAGLPFSTAHAPNQMLWIGFPRESDGEVWDEQMLRGFSTMTRRNIRLSQKQELELREVVGESEMRQAYSIIEANGRQQGYATRSWDDFGPTLLDQVAKRQAIMLVARHCNMPVGAHYGVLAGGRYSYLLGGTVRDGGDLKIGHFLHWMAMRKARELDLLGYDLTSGGSAGVMRFKMGFRPEHIAFVSPRYYVFSRWRFELFTRCYPWLRKHKLLVSRVLSLPALSR
ncbi:MAG: GNAT family N-acetyltransferase [Chloroflexi bacterium]|nr:MAG: GNAT family N-acetyltransferase [Chloroflexota bacterium]